MIWSQKVKVHGPDLKHPGHEIAEIVHCYMSSLLLWLMLYSAVPDP